MYLHQSYNRADHLKQHTSNHIYNRLYTSHKHPENVPYLNMSDTQAPQTSRQSELLCFKGELEILFNTYFKAHEDLEQLQHELEAALDNNPFADVNHFDIKAALEFGGSNLELVWEITLLGSVIEDLWVEIKRVDDLVEALEDEIEQIEVTAGMSTWWLE